jgi:nicotinamidase-related amidase
VWTDGSNGVIPYYLAGDRYINKILLKYLRVTLILTGIAGDICVLFSGNDAYVRDFHIIIPPDCSASEDPPEPAGVDADSAGAQGGDHTIY